MKTKVLVVDDHPITRIGVQTILKTDSSIVITDDAKDGMDAIRKVSQNTPDIVIMDITMPGLSGIDATREILKKYPEIKIIALSIHSGEKFVKEMLDAGASGYLLKDEAAEELLIAIEKVRKGEMYLSSAVTKTALQGESLKISRVNIMKTKLLRPLVTDELVRRNKIIDELEQNVIRPVTIVSAGPGYGKSISVSQWLEASKYPYAWITLDQEHDDLRTFLYYLKTAVEMVFPGTLQETGKTISATDLPPLNKLLYILFNDLCDIEKEMILVLDDFHKINDSKIHKLFNDWLHLPPPNIHLCLITRRDPPLKTELLKATGRISEIRMDQLSFTNEEIHQLYKQLSGVDLDESSIQDLQEKTEGWIIALRLAAMAIKGLDDIDRVLNALNGGLKSISDYLISEILLKLSPSIKQLLLISSLPNRFSVKLLKGIGLESDEITVTDFLEWLKKSNMFLTELDDEGTWYRYHNLFQLLLYNQLKREQSQDSLKRLHAKVSIWFEENELLYEAIHHAVIVNDYARAGEIIKNHRLRLLNENKWIELGQIVEQLPDNVVNGDIDLMLALAYSLMYQANYAELTLLVDRMEVLETRIDKKSIQFGEYNFFKGYINFVDYNKMDVCMKCFDLAMNIIPRDSGEPMAITELNIAVVSQILGQHKQANETTDRKIRGSKNDPYIIRNKLFQGYLMSNTAEADLVAVEKYILRAMEVARESKMMDSIGMSLMLAGMFYLRKGEWETANKYLVEVLDHKYSIQLRSVIDSITGLIVIHYITGQRESSAEMLAELANLLNGKGDYYDQFLWSCELRYHTLHKDKHMIRQLLKRIDTPTVLDLAFWFDIPAISYCRALLFEGSEENLILAEKKLEELIQIMVKQHNYIHQLEVYALQAILANIQEKRVASVELLKKSFALAEPAGIIAFFVELGESLVNILKNFPKEEFEKSYIKKILVGFEKSKKMQKNLSSISSPGEISAQSKIQLDTLTQRELDVLLQVARGMRNQEIASYLYVSEDTVKKHLYNMFQKFNVKNRMSLVHKAKEDGIIS